ncbi:hypothetical protein K501DRAFT_288266, partial [Backusella circina FSU 941]
MRLKLSFEIILIIFIYIYSVNAAGCILFCNDETSTAATSATATETSKQVSAPVDPTSSSATIPSVAPTSSSVQPTSTSKSSSIITPTSSSVTLNPTSSSSIMSSMTTSMSSSSMSSSPSASAAPDSSSDSGTNKTGVIIGSVCAFVAIIGAGFAYAFFSKTRRQNRRNQDYQQQHDMYNETPYSDPFVARPSPGITPAVAMNTTESLHYQPNYQNQQWEMEQQQQYYNNQTAMFSPVPSNAASPYAPPVNYPVQMNDPFNNYYDPNAAYSQPYENYAAQPPMASHVTNPTVYSSPHSYPDDHAIA